VVLVRIGYGATYDAAMDHGKPTHRINISGLYGQKLALAWSLPVVKRKFRYNHVRMDKNYAYYPVRGVRGVSYSGDVFNLEVAQSNTYCVPFVVHNCEKDAISGVLSPLARELHVTLVVNRGYSSQSAMYEASKRFIEHGDADCTILYLGDHDPSGEDMVRDVRDRLRTFGAEVHVEKIALTMDQIEEYNPPPNPAKVSDPRAAEYIAKHGDSSWEVDALPPDVLQDLIRDSIKRLVDQDLLDDMLNKEDKDKEALKKALSVVRRKK
jgi:hypothetical protein